MIQCHVFNSFTRLDLREGAPYMFSQFIGGMAAPLFLFMAGITTAFQMESMERRGASGLDRLWAALRRAGYIWGIAFVFRFTNWAPQWPNGSVQELTKVDILNCMGLGLAVFAAVAPLGSKARARAALLGGLAVAGFAPIVANLDWSGVPQLIHEHLAPGQGRGRFAFFPCASYLGFGIAAGTALKRTAADRLERFMQWCVPIGFALIYSARYFAELPFSIYEKASFWSDSPALILIRVGIAVLILAGAYVWTEHCFAGGWSWMGTLGKCSLLTYWVHVVLVYGAITWPLKRALTIPQAALATALMTAAMVGLAEGKLRWVSWRAKKNSAPPPPQARASAPAVDQAGADSLSSR